MKKISCLLILCLFLTSCPEDIRSDRYYILENKSNRELTLKFYFEGNLLDYLTTSLSINEKYSGSLRYENDTYLFNFVARTFNSDSIVIDFDNLKRRTYTIDFLNESYSEPVNRNIFRHENYENIGNDRFIFSVTEEDYNTAEDIN